MSDVKKAVERICSAIELLKLFPVDDQIQAINDVKVRLHEISPFSSEPVDCVIWVKADDVIANDYNPNSVAPPEMELLATSILSDGYTQPIVTWPNGHTREVVDGFHRNRVGRENPTVSNRVHGYLPVVTIKSEQSDKSDRMAATIRHNRARGKHRIEAMSEIVLELKRRNWSPKKIGKELGMDQDEVLRLVQISGLADMFKNAEFSEAWEVDEADISPVVDVGGSEIQHVGESEGPAVVLEQSD